MRSRRRIIALVVIAAVVVAALGATAVLVRRQILASARNATVDIAHTRVENGTLGGQPYSIIRPSDRPSTKLALVIHGYQADQNVPRAAYMATFTRQLADRGWTLASSNAYGDDWGSQRSQAAYAALYRKLAPHFEQTVLVSLSMGGIAGLHLNAEGVGSGWYGISAVTDLTAMSKETAYRDPISKALTPAQVRSLDPAQIPADELHGPLVLSYAPKDVDTPPASQAKPFLARTHALSKICSGGHLDSSCFDASLFLRTFD